MKAARVLAEGSYPVNRHPVLYPLAVAGGMKVFGDYPPVWRLVSLISGVALIFSVYFLARKITGEALAAFLAAFVMTFDGLTMVLSRVTMLNVTMLLFMILSFLCYLYRDLADEKKRARAFLLSGIFLGLAVSVRWFGVLAAVLLGTCLLHDLYRSPSAKRPGLVKDVFVYFVCLPLLVYLGTHLVIPLLKGKTLADIWAIHVSDFRYHTRLVSKHKYGSDWWSWPYMARPLWFHFRGEKTAVTAIHAAANPAVIWLTPLVMLLLAVEALRRKSRAAALVLAGFLCSWVPYAFIGRITYFHYFHTAMPFVAIGTGMGLAALWKKSWVGRSLTLAYAVILLGMFAFWYPMQTAHKVPRSFYKLHVWFKTWI